jgi:hypothetical protein
MVVGDESGLVKVYNKNLSLVQSFQAHFTFHIFLLLFIVKIVTFRSLEKIEIF